MAFDLSTAKEVAPVKSGFDLSTAKSIDVGTSKIYDEEVSKTIEVSNALDDKEVEYTSKIAGRDKNPNNFIGMTEVDDDVGFFTKAANTLSNIPKGIEAGIKQAPQIMGGLLKEMAENQKRVPAGTDPLRAAAMFDMAQEDVINPLPINTAIQKTADDMIANNRAMLSREGLLRPEDGGLDGFLFDVGQGTTSILVALGLTAATKSPVPAGVLFGTIQNSSIYVEAVESGATPREAANVAGLAGATEASLEMIGLDRFFKIGVGDKIINKIIKRSIVEATQEATQTSAEAAITNVSGVRDTTLEEAAQDVAYSALLGFVVGAPAATVVSLSERRAKDKGVKQEQIEQIKAAVQESEATPRMEMLLEKENSGVASTPAAEAERANNVRKAIAESIVEAAKTREAAAVEFIKKEIDVEQQRQLSNIQAETDDIQINLLREIENIQQNKNIIDPQTTQLLEQTAEALKEKRTIKKPQSLTEFIKSKGGLVELAGEGDLASIGVSKQQLAKWKKNGKTVDEMGEAAFEEGFFLERPTTAEFLEAFDADFKGDKVYSDFDLGDAIRLDSLDNLLSLLNSELNQVGITFNRDVLASTRKRIAANKKLDKAASTLELRKVKALEKLEKKAEKVAAKKPKIFADKLKTYVAGLKKGKVLAKKEIKDAQTQLIKLLDDSKLQAEDKAKFIKTIKNIQTSEQLVKKLDEVEARVRELEMKTKRRNLRVRLKRELKAIKAIKQSGKPKGKFTPEIQDALEIINAAFKLPKLHAATKLNENLAKIEEVPTVQEALENRVLALVADGADAPIVELNSLLADVRSLKETGKLANKKSLLARQERSTKLKEDAIEEVTGGDNIYIQDNTSLKAKIRKNSKNLNAALAGWNYGWFDTIDVLFNKSARGKRLRDELQVTELFQAEKGTGRRLSEELTGAAEQAYNMSDKALLKKFTEDSVVKPLGVFTNTAGVDVRLEYSRAQARKLWMEFQDPSLTETLTRELTKEEFRDGKGNGITEDMKNAIFGLLTREDIRFARAQMEIYNKFYDDVNEVYSRIYGVNLPKNDNYSPISRQIGNESTTDAFLKEIGNRRAVASGGLKSRVANTRTLKKANDINVFQTHVVEMAHFIHFAEKTQELNGLFGNQAVRKVIEAKNGKYILQIIDGFIEDFTRGGIRRGNALDDILNYFNSAFAKSVLAAKPVMTAKQLVSFIAYADTIPVKDFMAGVADFAKNRKKAVDILSKTDLMQNRGVSIDQEIARAGKEIDFNFLNKKATLDELLLKPIQWGDRGAIYVGGWAVYKHAINQGKTHEQAIKEFEKTTSLTQQSRDLDQLSQLQRGGAFARTMTMFMSSPNAYFRAEMRAIRQFKRGQITKREFLKKIAIYHFILPSLFQFVSDGFEWDGDHQLRVTVLGSLNGFFVFGDIVSNAIASLQGDYFWGDSSPFVAMQDIGKGVVKVIDAVDTEDLLEAIKDISEGVGKGVGLPITQAFNAATGVSEISEGLQTNDGEEVLTGSKRVLGWSAGSVED